MHSFIFSKASQARFEHHGKDRRKRGDIFRIETPYRTVEIYVSAEGKSLRVFDMDTLGKNGRRGRELK